VSELEIVRFVAQILETIWSLADKFGHRDAVLQALDSSLAAVRQRTDADLRKKHK